MCTSSPIARLHVTGVSLSSPSEPFNIDCQFACVHSTIASCCQPPSRPNHNISQLAQLFNMLHVAARMNILNILGNLSNNNSAAAAHHRHKKKKQYTKLNIKREAKVDKHRDLLWPFIASLHQYSMTDLSWEDLNIK